MAHENGTVYLVGAGPGDPDLATKRAFDLLARADVIVYDRLVSPRLLDGTRPEVELAYAGKDPRISSIDQEEIGRLLITRAREGKLVVRLKGGDPFVFGRGGEEAEMLREAGIEFQVVPGVTAGVAAPAYAGIPVTHRDQASAVAFVTGHEDPAKEASVLDWPALAAFPGTLVFYMSVSNLELITTKLIEHGRAADEPAAVVERATLPGQRTVTAVLGQIAARAQSENVRAPAATIVGAVAALHDRLAWLERAPLHGTRIAVTRARAQASALAERLTELGAEIIEAPVIRIEPAIDSDQVRQAVRRIGDSDYEVVCLTSPNGARLLLAALEREDLDARALAGTTLAAIGPGTAATLAEHGLKADVVPEHSIAESLAAELAALGLSGKRVLIARAAEARDVLPRSLEGAGAAVDTLAIYDTLAERLDEHELEAVAQTDYVTFTSSSTVRFFLEAIGGAEHFPAGARSVSIGPVTTGTARDGGLEIHAEAEHHDIDGLVEALLRDALAHHETVG